MNVPKFNIIAELEGHEGPIRSLAHSAFSSKLYSGSQDAALGLLLSILDVPHISSIRCLGE